MLQFKKLKELSTAIFKSSINILVILWFKSTWTNLEIKGCTLAKYQQSQQKSCRINQRSIFCDLCEKWIHFKHTFLTSEQFDSLGTSDWPYFVLNADRINLFAEPNKS